MLYVVLWCSSQKNRLNFKKIVPSGPYLEKKQGHYGPCQNKVQFFLLLLKIAKKKDHKLSRMIMSYERFSILCDILLAKRVIYS